MDAVAFGWFYPFFFVRHWNPIRRFGRSFQSGPILDACWCEFVFLILFLVIRGAPVFLLSATSSPAPSDLPFRPFVRRAVACRSSWSLRLSAFGTGKTMSPDIAAALFGSRVAVGHVVFPRSLASCIAAGKIGLRAVSTGIESFAARRAGRVIVVRRSFSALGPWTTPHALPGSPTLGDGGLLLMLGGHHFSVAPFVAAPFR
jgi:hypothetical protein